MTVSAAWRRRREEAACTTALRNRIPKTIPMVVTETIRRPEGKLPRLQAMLRLRKTMIRESKEGVAKAGQQAELRELEEEEKVRHKWFYKYQNETNPKLCLKMILREAATSPIRAEAAAVGAWPTTRMKTLPLAMWALRRGPSCPRLQKP